jgi:hypothetical protein
VTVLAYELAARARRRPAAPGGEPQPRRRGSPVTPAARREILARSDALLARIGYPTRSLRSHPHRVYLDPLRAGAYSREQARWLLGLIARLEQALGMTREDRGGG